MKSPSSNSAFNHLQDPPQSFLPVQDVYPPYLFVNYLPGLSILASVARNYQSQLIDAFLRYLSIGAVVFHGSARRFSPPKSQVVVPPILSFLKSHLSASSLTSKFNVFRGCPQSLPPVHVFLQFGRPTGPHVYLLSVFPLNLIVSIFPNALGSCLRPSFVHRSLIRCRRYLFSPFSTGIKIVSFCLFPTLYARVNPYSLSVLFLTLFRKKFNLTLFCFSNIFLLQTSVLLSSVCSFALGLSLRSSYISKQSVLSLSSPVSHLQNEFYLPITVSEKSARYPSEPKSTECFFSVSRPRNRTCHVSSHSKSPFLCAKSTQAWKRLFPVNEEGSPTLPF